MVITIVLAATGAAAVTALATALWPAQSLPAGRPGERSEDRADVRARNAGAVRGGGRSAGSTVDPARRAGAGRAVVSSVSDALSASGVPYPGGLGRWAARRGAGIRVTPQDLAISGYEHDDVLTAKILTTTAAAVSALASGVVLNRVFALGLPGVGVLLLALLFGAAAYLLPDAVVRSRARARRYEFEQALPVWCDLVALEMAGSAAPQEALVTAAEAGTTWPMHVVRNTLYRAVRAREPHWPALMSLGQRIGVEDLAQLGRLSQLVSHEGAQVRDTLIERAASMRRRALASALGQAGQRDESMRLAVLVIAAGVILLLLYPGVIAVMNL
ncbi:hypothetical protein Kisp01_65980 [Kineosporia sp. NBRC 101677]|uniref:hypothetical protein n=1 Tax=Kineosporia sp. NBRC 101677 TaxID=3032197 RepID=UPI0024A40B96|nr:hypothetical protein [Kineosporia sp. NBRC 101677]GLY19584.1 hypothetical protein Kisp01_65980 [Kineosporia sp. NBRC 101677]